MAPGLISLTTDFGVQTQSVGLLEGTAFAIAPQAKVIHLMHGLPAYDTLAAARTLETARYLPVGNHVCVCDPGVGTDRRAIICEVGRGDHLIGPDNGVLIPASRILGGIRRAHEITNPEYMRLPVSPIFHGRDIFVPAAAHLANGVPISQFGPSITLETLVPPPYDEATVNAGVVAATVIQINRFGSLHLNILHEQWDRLGLSDGDTVTLRLPDGVDVVLPVGRTFADVAEGECLILRDDYGRVEVAKNLAAFVEQYPVRIGQQVEIVVP